VRRFARKQNADINILSFPHLIVNTPKQSKKKIRTLPEKDPPSLSSSFAYGSKQASDK